MKMNIEQKIRDLITKALKKLEPGSDVLDFVIEHPNELDHGDYATNVALVCAKQVGKNPKEFAESIVLYIDSQKTKEIEKIEIAGPGFINFYLSKVFYEDQLKEILEAGEHWGKNDTNSGKKIMVEYTDPNPFKAFHIGHLMGNAIGESISRLIEYSGAEVTRANYQGDVGLHVAKAIWGLQHGHGGMENTIELGVAYAAGSAAYEENKQEINRINKAIYEGSDEAINKLYEEGRKISLEHFEDIYRVLGTTFDPGFYFFESQTWRKGVEIVNQHMGDVFEESEGAVVFKGEKYDNTLHTRVFINSEGIPTYEAKDLGLAYKKNESGDFDTLITITAVEQKEYFKVLRKALEQFDKELADKIVHISHGMMRLPSGKMSSRTGNVVTGESLIDSVKKRVLEITKERNIENQEEIAEKIAIAAIKYSILRSHAGNDIIYDLEKSLSFEGDSGPYLQYAHTRAQSILEKKNAVVNAVVNSEEISDLEKILYRFPEVVKEASEEYAPHHIVQYLTQLAGEFNSFYAHTKILNSENESYNVALTKAFALTMVNGLYLLGIKVPEKM